MRQGIRHLRFLPTPTTAWTNLQFQLSTPSSVQIDAFNTAGKNVLQIAKNQQFSAGYHEKEISTQELPAGIYLIKNFLRKLRI